VLVVVLENPDRFAMRLTEQISCRTSVSFAVTESQCTEDEHDDEDEDLKHVGVSASGEVRLLFDTAIMIRRSRRS
jgi:hypothetical protein